jgi:hypothetical protein
VCVKICVRAVVVSGPVVCALFRMGFGCSQLVRGLSSGIVLSGQLPGLAE